MYVFQANILLYLMIAWLSFKTTYCIDCYECSDVKNVTDCQHITTCSPSHYCYTDTSGIGEQTRFTLGCRPEQICLAPATTTHSSMSIIGRSLANDLECSQCCAVDSCNKHLCTTGTHAVSSTVCEDDPTYNCAQISSIFSICSDVHHAKLVCQKFCGLCHIVPGKWSLWSSWSACDATCGDSTKSRSRTCTPPKNGGLPCTGPSTETVSCNVKSCPVHGGWSLWTMWGSCSITCGIGLERRDRTCSNPYSGPGGDPCHGDSRDDRACFIRACADGVWSSWSTWNTCSATCLGGISKRNRRCNNPAPSTFGHDCIGNDEETKSCNSVACPGYWSSWTSWGQCSEPCGVGMKERTRICSSNFGCIGNSNEKDICNAQSCAVQVRLVDGSHRYEGRLEVFHNGVWGTVCDDSFTELSATVVCRMLKYPGNTPRVYPSAHFGSGTLPILLDDVKCGGGESTISACSHKAWGSNNCGHGEDVGISCLQKLHVRLIGGIHAGRVEVSVDGSNWGTVCDDGFSANSAKVVCKMLGYPASHARADGGVSPGSGPIFLDDVSCTGDESSLTFCSHTLWSHHDCSHGEDVGVICA